ncbi:ankyrin repeat domain-containing protein [Endozoicomonas sp. ONNA2]|uniref:ankyrin repeat domain-containing protein n=1 Tax=Endozoicomonas sp. ONNA2 TaxID=2828741 RepID=UPI0021472EA0|nr:ankyrin repeat domain-containing protein [Endozoicomonas sp. ONNA2]
MSFTKTVQPGSIPQSKTDEMMDTGDPLIPAKKSRYSALDNVSLPCRTVTIVDVEHEFPGLQIAEFEIPGDSSQTSSAAEITQVTLTSRFQSLCNADDGEELARLLSNTDETTRDKWFKSSLAFNEKNDTPMIYAARHGCAAVVAALISHQADPCEINPLSTCQCHALAIAAQENQGKVIQEMTKSKYFDPDKPRGDGATALMVAVESGHTEITKLLLECKADPNYKVCCTGDFSGKSDIPLRLVGNFGEQETKPSTSTSYYTPVMFAVKSGNVTILEQLLTNGGNPNSVDPANPLQASPLLIAVSTRASSAETANLLLKHKADMHKPNFYGLSDVDSIAGSVSTNIGNKIESANRTPEKDNRFPTLFETVCFLDRLDFYNRPNELVEVFCNYYRTPKGTTVDAQSLKYHYAGQYLLKYVAFQTDPFEFDQIKSMKHFLCQSLSSLLVLNFVFGQEESCKSSFEKYNAATTYMEEIKSRLLSDIDNADTTKLQEKIVSALKSFNNYFLDLNDEFVNMFLNYNFMMDGMTTCSKLKDYFHNLLVICEKVKESESAG